MLDLLARVQQRAASFLVQGSSENWTLQIVFNYIDHVPAVLILHTHLSTLQSARTFASVSRRLMHLPLPTVLGACTGLA